MKAGGHVVGIVHARGGSRRIPLKNLALVGGRPLVAWMIEAATQSRTLERVIVSTDHDGIAQTARRFGAEVPFMRPARLATDCPSELVTQHAVRYLERHGYPVAIAVTLQPTAPFCRSEDIDACVQQLRQSRADTVMTVRRVHERPEWMYRLVRGRARSLLSITPVGAAGISQRLPKLYLPNGAVYATTRECLMRQGRIIGPHVRAVVMPDERSLDIDEPLDLLLANLLAARMRRRSHRG